MDGFDAGLGFGLMRPRFRSARSHTWREPEMGSVGRLVCSPMTPSSPSVPTLGTGKAEPTARSSLHGDWAGLGESTNVSARLYSYWAHLRRTNGPSSLWLVRDQAHYHHVHDGTPRERAPGTGIFCSSLGG
jgi:hypothetical protein